MIQQRKAYIPLLAFMMSMVALTIDIMLPAILDIGEYFDVEDENSTQLIISAFFLGLAVSQIFYGPISESIGRKPSVYIGFAIFLIGTLLCLFSPTFEIMLVGRVIQGLGLAAFRVVSLAIVRDSFRGDKMASAISQIMMFFILVPILAPALGSAILQVANWRWIYGSLVILSTLMVLFFVLFQEETLLPQDRIAFTLSNSKKALLEIARNKISSFYIIIATLVFAMFIGYLNSIKQILQHMYSVDEDFALWFAVYAISVGLASFLNGRIVERFGMYFIVRKALLVIIVLSGVLLGYSLFFGILPMFLFHGTIMIILFAVGFLFGNLNAIILEPLGHIAGFASSVSGSVTTLFSIFIGSAISLSFNYTLIPMYMGFFVLSICSLLLERKARPYQPERTKA